MLWAAFVTSAAIAGIAAIAFGVFVLVGNGDGDAAAPPTGSATPTISVTPSPVPSPTGAPPTASATPSPTQSPTPSPSPTPTPAPPFDAFLGAWSDATSTWVLGALSNAASNYNEDDSVPLLLRIDGTEAGTRHEVSMTYDCASSGSPAVDYLGGLAADDTEPALTDPGPGRANPDATLIVPDDPSIDFDDANEVFSLWGGTFSQVDGPRPESGCSGTKTVDLSLTAFDETIYLVWTAHLGSAADWGAGQGASSATPFGITVEVDGFEFDLSFLAGSVDG